MHILVMRIAIGKTNGLKVLYGRATCHKDVTQCPIGALAMYLHSRFELTGEGEKLDFSQNSSWFNVKLLIDPRGSNNEVSVSDQNYANSIKEVCRSLNIASKHFIHFGRGVGSVLAELDELDGHHIQDLGNWNVDVRRDVYSAKLPMKAMWVMGGHPEAKGSVFLPRAGVQPPENLQKRIFPFVETAITSIRTDGSTYQTALAFLNVLKRLRVVLLQDVAAMMILGRLHYLFEYPVFKHADFVQFISDLHQHIEAAIEPADHLL